MHKKRTVLFDGVWWVVFVSCLPAAVFAEETPTYAEIVERIQQTESLIKNFQVTEKTVRRQRAFNSDKILEATRFCTWTITDDGRVHYEMTGNQFNFGPDGTTLYPLTVDYTDDDQTVRQIKTSFNANGETAVFGEVDDNGTYYTQNPSAFTVFIGPESLLALLEKKKYSVVGAERYDELDVIVLESEPTERQGTYWTRRIYFHMDMNTLVRMTYGVKSNLNEEWFDYVVWEGHDYREIVDGVWMPHRYKKASYAIGKTEADGEPALYDGFEGTYSAWKVNVSLPENAFHLDFPAGCSVNDHRPAGKGRLLSEEEIAQLNGTKSDSNPTVDQSMND